MEKLKIYLLFVVVLLIVLCFQSLGLFQSVAQTPTVQPTKLDAYMEAITAEALISIANGPEHEELTFLLLHHALDDIMHLRQLDPTPDCCNGGVCPPGKTCTGPPVCDCLKIAVRPIACNSGRCPAGLRCVTNTCVP